MTTKRVRGYVRNPATGAGIAGATVALKLHAGGTVVISDGTDANGLFEVDADALGYPGPIYEEVTVGTTTKIASGNTWAQLGGLIWPADLPDVLAALGIGVLGGVGNELAVTADASGMEVHVNSGTALLKDGIPYVKEATSNVVITAANATNPRIDRIVLRLTREGQTAQGKIDLLAIPGTPAASPVAPALVQTAATWDLGLATVTVDANALSIASGKVADTRTYIVSNERLTALETQALGIRVEKGDSIVDAAATTLDFDATDFTVTSSPAGEANIALNYGTGVGVPAQGAHSHGGYLVRETHAQRDIVASGGLTISSTTGAVITGLSDTMVLANGLTYDIFVMGMAMLSAGTGGSVSVAIDISGTNITWTPVYIGVTTEGGERTVMPTARLTTVVGVGQTITVTMLGKRVTASGIVGSASFQGFAIAREAGATV